MKQSTSVVSKILTFSLLLGACVGGTALSVSAEPYLTHDVSEPAPAEPVDDGPVTAQDLMAAGGTLNVRGEAVSLGPMKIVENTKLVSFHSYEDDNHNPTGVRLDWNSSSSGVNGRAAYQIRKDGVPTPYWIQTGFFNLSSVTASASCEIFEGEPGTAEATVTWKSGYQCVTKRHGLDRDWDFSIEPVVTTSSAGGTFNVRAGGVALGPMKIVENTKLVSFRSYEDDNHNPTGVRLEWNPSSYGVNGRAAYQIRKDGVPTPYWIQIGFFHLNAVTTSASCEIFEGEPGTAEAKVTWYSGFQCVTNRHGLDRDWDFTIEPREYRWSARATFDVPGMFVVGKYKLTNDGFDDFHVVNNKVVNKKFGPHQLIAKWNPKATDVKGTIEFDVQFHNEEDSPGFFPTFKVVCEISVSGDNPGSASSNCHMVDTAENARYGWSARSEKHGQDNDFTFFVGR